MGFAGCVDRDVQIFYDWGRGKHRDCGGRAGRYWGGRMGSGRNGRYWGMRACWGWGWDRGNRCRNDKDNRRWGRHANRGWNERKCRGQGQEAGRGNSTDRRHWGRQAGSGWDRNVDWVT